MVIDYTALNKLTVEKWFALPKIDNLFDKLHGAQYITSLDAASGFHQIQLREKDRPKTAVNTTGSLPTRNAAIRLDKCASNIPGSHE